MQKSLLRVICLLIFILSQSYSFAQITAAKLKAVFVIKFIENVKWPSTHTEIILGIIGNTDVGDELQERLKSKNQLNLTIKSITASDVSSCHAVFVSGQSSADFKKANDAIGNQPILLITETDHSLHGACISLIEEGGKMQFKINKDALESKGLKVSTSLLTLSK